MEDDAQRRFHESMQKLQEVLNGGFIYEEEFVRRKQKLQDDYNFEQKITGLQTEVQSVRTVEIDTPTSVASNPIPMRIHIEPAAAASPLKMETMKRLTKELQQCKTDPMEGISVECLGEDLRAWQALILGPDNSPYVSGQFPLEIAIPDDYPFKPPKIRFMCPVYHPNINSVGTICLDILSSNWSPALTIGRVLLSIRYLLKDPNPHDALNNDVAKIFLQDRASFNATAAAHTKQHACGRVSKQEKQSLVAAIMALTEANLSDLVTIIHEKNGVAGVCSEDDEVEIDIDALPDLTVRRLQAFVAMRKQ